MTDATTPLGGEPLLSGRYLLTIDHVEIGIFQSVSGLEVSIGTTDVIEGGQNQYVHKLPGRFTWPNITLTRGITVSNELFAWFSRISGDGYSGNGNKVTRSTGAIVVVDGDGQPMRSWNFVDAFPVRWKGPSFSGDGNDALVEELELAHHGFRAENGAKANGDAQRRADEWGRR